MVTVQYGGDGGELHEFPWQEHVNVATYVILAFPGIEPTWKPYLDTRDGRGSWPCNRGVSVEDGNTITVTIE